MKKDLVEYINGSRNVVKDEFIIGRERMKNSEMIFVSVPGSEVPLYALINAKKAKGKYKVQEDGEEVARIERRQPKGTGGKPAYAMLMLAELEKLKLSIEAAGLLFMLIPCLEWNTGRVMQARTNKPMTKQAMSRQLHVGKVKLKGLLAQLAEAGVMGYDTERKAYCLNSRYIKKGMSL